jgi:hypothetical protein
MDPVSNPTGWMRSSWVAQDPTPGPEDRQAPLAGGAAQERLNPAHAEVRRIAAFVHAPAHLRMSVVNLLAARLPGKTIELVEASRIGVCLTQQAGPLDPEDGTVLWSQVARAVSRTLSVWPHTIDEDFLARTLMSVVDDGGAWLPDLPDKLTKQAAREAQRCARHPRYVRRDILIDALGGPRRIVDVFEQVLAAYLAGKPLPRYLDSYCQQLLGARVDPASSRRFSSEGASAS